MKIFKTVDLCMQAGIMIASSVLLLIYPVPVILPFLLGYRQVLGW